MFTWKLKILNFYIIYVIYFSNVNLLNSLEY